MCVEGIGYDSCLEGGTSERIVTTPFFHVSTLVSRPFLAFPKSQDPLVKRFLLRFFLDVIWGVEDSSFSRFPRGESCQGVAPEP